MEGSCRLVSVLVFEVEGEEGRRTPPNEIYSTGNIWTRSSFFEILEFQQVSTLDLEPLRQPLWQDGNEA